jgi:hypothetical protein
MPRLREYPTSPMIHGTAYIDAASRVQEEIAAHQWPSGCRFTTRVRLGIMKRPYSARRRQGALV